MPTSTIFAKITTKPVIVNSFQRGYCMIPTKMPHLSIANLISHKNGRPSGGRTLFYRLKADCLTTQAHGPDCHSVFTSFDFAS